MPTHLPGKLYCSKGLCLSWGLRLPGTAAGASGARGGGGCSELRKAPWRLSWEAPPGCGK